MLSYLCPVSVQKALMFILANPDNGCLMFAIWKGKKHAYYTLFVKK